MLSSVASAQTRYTTVVIDAGHGGFDRGGIPRQTVPEKNMTLDVALKLKPILEKAGYRVVMTRSTDVFVPLGTRVVYPPESLPAIVPATATELTRAPPGAWQSGPGPGRAPRWQPCR